MLSIKRVAELLFTIPYVHDNLILIYLLSEPSPSGCGFASGRGFGWQYTAENRENTTLEKYIQNVCDNSVSISFRKKTR